jgi:WD40 repeat protein
MGPIYADVLLRYVRQQVAAPGPDADTDRALIQRFAAAGDETAFDTLVRRHGPMVLRVCRHVLGNVHDAEDACQATFLVLARKAGALLWRESVAGWLYQVASRVALQIFTHNSKPAAQQAPEASRQVGEVPAERAGAAITKKLATLRGHGSAINALALSPDGKTLASAGTDFLVELWDVDGKASKLRGPLRQGPDPLSPILVQPTPTHNGMVWAVAFSPDGKTVASGAGFVQTRTPEGRMKFEGEVRLWDAATGKEQAAVRRYPVSVHSLAFSPDSRTLAWGGGVQTSAIDTTPRQSFKDIPRNDEELGEVRVWDLATGKERTFFHCDDGWIKSVAFSPDGKTLASGGRDSAIRLFDVATGRERACLRDRGCGIRAVVFSPDGKTLASVPGVSRSPGTDKQGEGVRLWDLATGRVRARLEAPGVRVEGVAFDADGRRVTTAGSVLPPGTDRGEVRRWETATGRPLGTPLEVDHNTSALAVGVGGKTMVLATAGSRGVGIDLAGEITLWELDPPTGTAP